MEYQKGDNVFPQKRHVDPYGLLSWKNKWYIVAYCHLRNEVRSFRVDRINSLSRTDLVFQRPSKFSARHFFLENMLPDFGNHKQLISVRIQGSTHAINDLCDHWLLSHALMERTKNEIYFKLDEKAITTYVPYLLLSYGTTIQVLEPSILKERVIAALSKLLNHYQKVELD